ncbi:uncharacterized protein TrAtP1_000708 [Trichoderma atroviride]|uniref:uncharacterized protein n=1 Tax=Hypocrea atroviridis TaxID=63577 RepID=UPI00333349A3|nr:hypothetical protein TrAtP1_000708 [Trichoderma atroviride]
MVMDATIALHPRRCQSWSKGASAYTPKACRAELLCSGRGLLGAGLPPIDYPHRLAARTASVLRGAEWRAAAGISRLANWIADVPSLPMSRYLRWCADATAHRKQ